MRSPFSGRRALVLFGAQRREFRQVTCTPMALCLGPLGPRRTHRRRLSRGLRNALPHGHGRATCHARWLAIALLAAAPGWLAGCTGRASLSAIPFSRADLRDQEPLVVALPTAARCAWYVDNAGQLTVAMKYENIPILGKFTKAQWLARFRLGEPPAGRSLRYNLYRDQVRGVCSSGVEHWRFQTRWGMLVLDRLPGERFRGRFQITVAQQQFTLFSGWSPAGFAAPLLIMWGEFEAVHDESFAKSVVATIDKENWEALGAFPTTRPIQTRPLPAAARTRPASAATRPAASSRP